MLKRSIPVKLKLNPTTSEETFSFFLKLTQIFQNTNKTLNLTFRNYNSQNAESHCSELEVTKG